MGSSFTVYQTFIGAMNEKIKRQLAISNPFVFRHIYNLKVCMTPTTAATTPQAVMWGSFLNTCMHFTLEGISVHIHLTLHTFPLVHKK